MSTRIVRYKIPSSIVPGSAIFAKQFGGSGLDLGYSVALDNDRNIIMAGFFQSSMTLGSCATCSISRSPFGSFIAWLSPSGEVTRAKAYAIVSIKALAVDSVGNIIAGGTFSGTVNLGGSDLVAAVNSQDCFLAKFDSQGNHTWSVKLSGGGTDNLVSIAIDSLDNIVATGSKGVSFTGFDAWGTNGQATNFPGGGGGSDTFIVKYTPAGLVTFLHSFNNAGDDFGTKVAIDKQDSSNRIWLAGATAQLINVGAGNQGGGYVVYLDENKNYIRSRQVGNNSLIQSMAMDAGGDIIMSGLFTGTTDLGNGSVSGGVDQYNQATLSAYVVKYSGATLAWQWQAIIRGSSNSGQFLGVKLAVDDQGFIWMSGQSQGTFSFESLSVPGVAGFGYHDGFLAKLSSAGAFLRVDRFTGNSTLDIAPNALVAGSFPVVVGSFTGTVTLGGEAKTSSGSDIFAVGIIP